jgi:hypothetical protein
VHLILCRVPNTIVLGTEIYAVVRIVNILKQLVNDFPRLLKKADQHRDLVPDLKVAACKVVGNIIEREERVDLNDYDAAPNAGGLRLQLCKLGFEKTRKGLPVQKWLTAKRYPGASSTLILQLFFTSTLLAWSGFN